MDYVQRKNDGPIEMIETAPYEMACRAIILAKISRERQMRLGVALFIALLLRWCFLGYGAKKCHEKTFH